VIDRKQEVPHEGPMCDLLWSDPDGESPVERSRTTAGRVYCEVSSRRAGLIVRYTRLGNVTSRSRIPIWSRRRRCKVARPGMPLS